MTCFSLMSQSEKFLYSYVIEYHVVEGALKERHLKGQSDRAVIFADIGEMSSVGPTLIVFIYILGVALWLYSQCSSSCASPFGRRPLLRSALAILNSSNSR